MDYFKKCPKCGRYMMPCLHFKRGNSYTIWLCNCGYFEDIYGTGEFIETNYTGGGASDRSFER